MLSIGIGWHLRATPNVRCSFARELMTAYLRRRANRRVRMVVHGYVCPKRDLPDAEHVSCVRARKLVTAKSYGY